MNHLIETQQMQQANAAMKQAMEVLQKMKFRLEKLKKHTEAEIEQKASSEKWSEDQRQAKLEPLHARETEMHTLWQLLDQCNALATDQHHWRQLAFTQGMQYGMEQHRPDPLMPTDNDILTMDADELITLTYARTWRIIFPHMSNQLCLLMATYYPTDYIDLIYINLQKTAK